MEEELPQYVEETLREVSEKLGMDRESAVQSYARVVEALESKGFDKQFADRQQFLIYAVKVWKIYVFQARSGQEYTVIPIGVREPQQLSNGRVRSRIYVIVLEKDGNGKTKPVLKVIWADNEQAGLYRQVQLFHKYVVRLRPHTSNPNVLWATTGTVFAAPEMLSLDAEAKIRLIRSVGVRPFRLREVWSSLSRTVNIGGREVPDDLDMRLLRGIIVDTRTGSRDGRQWCRIDVSDDSIPLGEETTDEEGRVIPSALPVWIPCRFNVFAVHSEVAVYGVLFKGRNELPIMNAVGVIPIHAVPLEVPQA